MLKILDLLEDSLLNHRKIIQLHQINIYITNTYMNEYMHMDTYMQVHVQIMHIRKLTHKYTETCLIKYTRIHIDTRKGKHVLIMELRAIKKNDVSDIGFHHRPLFCM